ncbi:hypothetical protein ABID65_009679 [Bradyrhizobium sp. S3.9.2]
MKRVFISFRHEDKSQVNGLRLLAANDKFDIEFYDESVQTAIDSQNATSNRKFAKKSRGRPLPSVW